MIGNNKNISAKHTNYFLNEKSVGMYLISKFNTLNLAHTEGPDINTLLTELYALRLLSCTIHYILGKKKQTKSEEAEHKSFSPIECLSNIDLSIKKKSA